MKIIILGAKGYISQNLGLFLKRKRKVIFLTQKGNKIKNFKKDECFKFNLIKNEIPKLSCDILIHSAGITPQKIYSAKKYNIVNFESLKKIIENIEIKKKIIFLSTTDVYKNNKNIVEAREVSKINLLNLSNYAKSKYRSEVYLNNLNKKKFSFEKIILRLPGIVGRKNHKNFISNLFDKILKNNKISYFGGNNLFNNIYHIEDLCKLIEVLLSKKVKKNCEIINVGTKKPISINKIISLFNIKSKIEIKKFEKKNSFVLKVNKLNKYYKKNPSTQYILKKYFNEKNR